MPLPPDHQHQQHTLITEQEKRHSLPAPWVAIICWPGCSTAALVSVMRSSTKRLQQRNDAGMAATPASLMTQLRGVRRVAAQAEVHEAGRDTQGAQIGWWIEM